MDMVELDFVAYIRKLLHRAKMSEEAFSVKHLAFGIRSGDACSWDRQSLLPPFCT